MTNLLENEAQKFDLVSELELSDKFKFIEDDPDFMPATNVDDNYWHNLAILSMELYFSNKSFHCGGKIPTKLLFSPSNINMVRDTVRLNSNGFELILKSIYLTIHTKSPKRFIPIDVQRPWDVIQVVSVLRDIHALRIPREFVPGIALLHFHFCEGFSIDKRIYKALIDVIPTKQMEDLIATILEEPLY